MTTKNTGQEGILWFFAIVEKVDDPLMLGRARIRVFGDHQNLDEEDLPWAIPLLPITSASMKGIGSSATGLEVGSKVFGMYVDGKEKQRPIIWGTLAQMQDLDFEKSDVSKLAREINHIQKTRLGPEPESAYAAKYPENKVYQSKSGHVIEIDDTEGEERLHFFHKSGAYTEINKDGRRVDKSEDYFEIIGKDKTSFVKGKYEHTNKGDVSINISGDINISAKNIELTGDVVNIKCKSFKVNGIEYSTLLSLQ